MKILAVIGSPKAQGSGYRLVRMIEVLMRSMGEVEFEYLFLKEADLKPCTGCYACMARGEDKCPLKDDRALIERRLSAADGVILSSPVHVDNVSGLMKNFIDRFAYRNHRPIFHRQKVLVVVNMAGTANKGALAALRLTLGGARIVQELVVPTPPWPQTERSVAAKERAIDAAARAFYQACRDPGLPPPTFKAYLNFLLMQRLSYECRQALPADHLFYEGKTYYYDAKIDPVKKAAARVLAGIMMYFYLKMGLGPGSITWPRADRDKAEQPRGQIPA